MAVGWKSENTHTMPTGRRPFASSGATVSVSERPEVIRPGTFSDAQPRMGTPKGRQSTRARSSRYESPEGRAYRAAHRESVYPGGTGRQHDNPPAHSKGRTFHGHPHTPGGARHPGEQARLSGERAAARLYTDPVSPSMAPKTYTERAKPHTEVVGWQPGSGVHRSATHPNHKKHYGGHEGALHANTDASQGQAWSASGGQFGRPSPRRPQSTGTTGTRKEATAALDRSRYSGGRYPGAK